jgi:Spy/CpxP family protein refolding chaperone
MLTHLQQKILIWSTVVLLVLNVSTMATIGFHAFQKDTISNTSQTENVDKSNFSSEKFSGRYFRDNLGLNADQMNDFFKINQPFRSEAFSIHEKLADIRKNMLEEMSAEKSDTLKLNELSTELGSLHARLKVISFKYYLNIKELCTAKQKVKLKDIFKNFFESETHIGFPGPGKNRRGQGWRNSSNSNN